MKAITGLISGIGCLLAVSALAAEPVSRTANNGNLVMQDIPPIPEQIVADLNRYQNVRSAGFRDWTVDGKGIYVTTRFGDVSQIHRVDMPGGARYQVTFYKEPIGGVVRQPGGSNVIFTRDAGGSEFSQLFLLNPVDGTTTMLTDGESRNRSTTWDRQGRRVAYMSTRRNGASNDIWMMDPIKARLGAARTMTIATGPSASVNLATAKTMSRRNWKSTQPASLAFERTTFARNSRSTIRVSTPCPGAVRFLSTRWKS